MAFDTLTSASRNLRLWSRAAALCSTWALLACGGGGNGGTGPLPAPAPGSSPPPPVSAPSTSLQLAYGTTPAGWVGRAYSVSPATLTIGGGAITACGINPGSPNASTFAASGLSIAATTCVISGTPSAALAATTFTVQVTNAVGATDEAPVSIEIRAAPTTFAYLPRDAANAVAIHALDATTGELSAESQATLPAGSAPRHVAYDATRGRLYIASFGANRIDVATVNATTGALSTPTTASSMQEPVRLAVHPAGQFLFVLYGDGSTSFLGVTTLRINANGTLTSADFKTLSRAPQSIAFDSSGNYVYVGMETGGIQPFAFDTTTGALTPQTIHPIGMADLAFGSGGTYLYAAQSLSSYINVYAFQAGGGLAAVEFHTLTGFPSAGLAMDPMGTYLYSLDDFSKAVRGLRINPADGKLTDLSSATLGSGCVPQALAMAPDAKSVHVACGGTGEVAGFSVNRGTGALSALPTSPSAVNARSITFVTP